MVSSVVFPVIVFTPTFSAVPPGTLIITTPANYLTGSPSFSAGASSKYPDAQSMTGTNTASKSTQLILTIGGSLTGTSAVTITLSSLTLGAAQSAGSFSLASCADAETVQKHVPLFFSSAIFTIIRAHNCLQYVRRCIFSHPRVHSKCNRSGCQHNHSQL